MIELAMFFLGFLVGMALMYFQYSSKVTALGKIAKDCKKRIDLIEAKM